MRRRDFLKTTGCLTIGFSLGSFSGSQAAPLVQNLPGSLGHYPNINAWLEVLANGSVRIFTGKLELGQGIRTAIAQVAAEELDLPMELTEVHLAETGITPNEGYTAGSRSIEASAIAVRYAAAAARQKLLQLAAATLKVPEAELNMANGKVVTKTGNSISFFSILDGRQITDEVRMPVKVKPKDQYRLVGRPVFRQDVNAITSGAPVYVHDLRFDGMVHARMVHPPAYGAKLLKWDEQAVRSQVPGLLKIVVNGSVLGVIGRTEYDAVRAQELVDKQAQWSTAAALPHDKELKSHLKALPAQTQRVTEKGDKLQDDAVTLQAAYYKPYIMHGSMGPSCAVALYDQQQLQVWTHSQGVYPLRETLAKLLDIKEVHIHIKGVPGPGCYGHNGADDVAAEAAILAMAYPGRHVRLQWSREDEHSWEPYGSAMIMELAARLDSAGKITHWHYDLWSDTHSTRPGGRPENLLPAQYLEKSYKAPGSGYNAGAYRNGEPYYTIPNQHLKAHFFKGPLRVSALRSLGAYANIFAIESFMDELAVKAGKDPYEFRLAHLQDERAKAVIRKLKEIVVPASGSGLGIAFARYKNSASYCAVAAQATVDKKNGYVHVKKMWAVIDAGETINPDGLRNQTEGGMVQSLSWTLLEQVLFDQQHITTRNWKTYPVLRFQQSPQVEVVIIDRPDEPVMGAGEAAQGPAAAAVANAVYHASGKRIRDLPILPEKLKG